jgi:ketosteroid isomerase-like protein
VQDGSPIEIVRRAFETFNGEGIEGVVALFAPDFEVTIPPSLSAEPDTYRGPDGVRRWAAGFDGSLEDVRLEAESLVEVRADTVVAATRLRARGIESGIEVDQLTGQLLKIRDGQVRLIEVYPTVDEALAAAGGGR